MDPEAPFTQLTYDPTRRSYFLGSLARAVKSGQTITIDTPYTSVEAFPPELRMLVDTKASGKATGVGASLSWIASRWLARGVAFSRAAGGVALLGVSTITLVVGVLLKVYSFRVRNETEPGGTLRLVGVPRHPARSK